MVESKIKKVNKLNLIIIMLFFASCTQADNQTKEKVNKKIEPYQLEIGVNKIENNIYTLEIMMELAEKSFFVSPYSKGNYMGRFALTLNENDKVKLHKKLIENPKAKQSIDPYTNKPVSMVTENTIYKQQFTVTNENDFDVAGLIQFVIEPQCTMEKISFTITSRSGKIGINKTPYLEKTKQAPHKYGGWYCPDNVKGFPAIDIKNWADVPVINNRLPTKEEIQSEASLIFVDAEKYPEAKTLNITMPKLATYYSNHTKKDEIVIIIQALKVQNDSIVGFRYLNGGNGSARLNEVTLLDEKKINKFESTSFVTLNLEIKGTQDEIWKVLTDSKYTKELQPIFDANKSLSSDWKEKSNVNYSYLNKEIPTAEIATNMYGSLYIQNDYNTSNFHYVEKFLLLENETKNKTELNIVCGPFGDDYETQKTILEKWIQKVKELGEK